jgi:hypothetical protein
VLHAHLDISMQRADPASNPATSEQLRSRLIGVMAGALLAMLIVPACGGGNGGGGTGGSSSSGGVGPSSETLADGVAPGLSPAPGGNLGNPGSLGGLGSGGGGGGGGDGGELDPATDFFLTAAYFGRPIHDVDGVLVDFVNPSSLHETDPLTNVAVPGFPKVLLEGTSLTDLASLNFVQVLDPLTPQIPLIPRNAGLVLEFSKDVDPSSLGLAAALGLPGTTGLITLTSAVQVRTESGVLAPARAVVDGKRIIVLPGFDPAGSWDASPLVFDTLGKVVSDPNGVLGVVIGSGAVPMTSTGGLALVPRTDNLGTAALPFPMNPGNPLLDAVVLQTSAGPIGFNGFLPDLSPPRIIRPVILEGTVTVVDPSVFDGGTFYIEITGDDAPVTPNALANEGLGEWMGGLLVVTSAGGGPVVSKYVVTSNTALGEKPVFRLVAGTVLDPSVGPGATFQVTRTEYFEPVPALLSESAAELANLTVDPASHPRDPLDSQDYVNHDLRYFARMLDTSGMDAPEWDPVSLDPVSLPGTFGAVDPKSSPTLLFSELMDITSFRSYETFYVTDESHPKTDPAFSDHRIGRAEITGNGSQVSFVPVLENQVDPGSDEHVGFGGTASSLTLVLRTIPPLEDINSLLASASSAQLDQYHDLTATGVLGLTDLGGRGLGLPRALLDQGDVTNFLLASNSSGRGAFPPAIDLELTFETKSTSDDDYRAIVHRFMGQAVPGSILYPDVPAHDSVDAGVEYNDFPGVDADLDGVDERKFFYGPTVFDIGLNLPGRMTGAPASAIEHLIDDFNKPKISPWASPNGEDFLVKLGFGSPTPLNSPFGARFQHIYRAGDASPAFNDFKGVVLDLVGLAWSPVGNFITTSTLDDIEILVGLSGVKNGRGPQTTQDAGIPDDDKSGLVRQFDCNLLEFRAVCCQAALTTSLAPLEAGQPPLAAVVEEGTPYTMSTGQLFAPANSAGAPAGQFNLYHNYPPFNTGIDPYFGKTDVFSIPYNSQFPMLVEYRIKPNLATPSSANFYRLSPGILSSVLPRFRVWSQGQSPLASCVGNRTLGATAGCAFKAGEGGPLLEPGSPLQGIPAGVNGQVAIPNTEYITPPMSLITPCTTSQPVINSKTGNDNGMGNIIPPLCNTNADTNWYYASGMFAFPLPDLTEFPGPTGQPPTEFLGYGYFGTNNGPVPLAIEPSYACSPSVFGDNSRYWFLWQYRKRVSIIESPTITVAASKVEYHVPIIDPPLSSVDPAAGLLVEFKAGSEIDFLVSVLDSGFVSQTDPEFKDKVTGLTSDNKRIHVKFRATFGVAQGETQPPSIDTIVIPYRVVP